MHLHWHHGILLKICRIEKGNDSNVYTFAEFKIESRGFEEDFENMFYEEVSW